MEIIEDVDRDSFFKALSDVPYQMEAKGNLGKRSI